MGSRTLLAVLLVALSVNSAQAAPMDALFSDESVEIRVDERLFTLLLLMNGMGWAEAAEYGPEPLKSPRFEGIRKDLISKLSSYRERYLPNRALDRAKRYVSEHPASLADYVEAALYVSSAPEFKMGKNLPKRLSKLKGLDSVLRNTWKEARVSVLMRRYLEPMTEAQRTILGRIDRRTKPLVRMLKAKSSAPKKDVKKDQPKDDMDDLFGGDDDGDDSTATADDATAELEAIAVSLAPLWRRDAHLLLRVGDRFELVFGGERGDGVAVAQRVALVRLRAAAGLGKKPVEDAQIRAAWGLVTAATGRQGPDQLAPYPACVEAIAAWKKTSLPLTEGDAASQLITACQVKGD